jgi:two-component system, cell cycle response regulator
MRILIAEDDPAHRRLLSYQLTRLGHEISEVGDGESAWQRLQEEHFALVITDWMMPALEGPELIRRIRNADLPAYTYIILLTSKGYRSDVVAGLDAGADDYLVKPVDSQELRARVAIGVRIVSLEQRLRHMSETDSLTGLLNRRAMTAASEQILIATSGTQPVSLILLDIDHFKRVNDRYGHLVGDEVLRLIANTVRQQVQLDDLVGRWGGEELIVLLPGLAAAEALAAAERLRTMIERASHSVADGYPIQVTASLGVTTRDMSAATSFTSLVKQADDCLYAAKRGGRNRVVEIAALPEPPSWDEE